MEHIQTVSWVHILSDIQSRFPTTKCNHQMGFAFGVPLPGWFHGVQNVNFTPSMVYSNVKCNGTEQSIWDCSMDIDDGSNTECCPNCYDKSVAVYCSRFC